MINDFGLGVCYIPIVIIFILLLAVFNPPVSKKEFYVLKLHTKTLDDNYNHTIVVDYFLNKEIAISAKKQYEKIYNSLLNKKDYHNIANYISAYFSIEVELHPVDVFTKQAQTKYINKYSDTPERLYQLLILLESSVTSLYKKANTQREDDYDITDRI